MVKLTTVGERSKIKVRNVILNILTLVLRARDHSQLIGKVNSRDSLDLSQLQLSIKNCIDIKSVHVRNYKSLLELVNNRLCVSSLVLRLEYFINVTRCVGLYFTLQFQYLWFNFSFYIVNANFHSFYCFIFARNSL